VYLLGYALVAVIALATSAVLLPLDQTTTRRRYHVSRVSSLFKQVMAVGLGATHEASMTVKF
jgi:hypothetical protein